MNLKKQKLILLLFLSTGYINNLEAVIIQDTTFKNKDRYFDSNIEKFAKDSIKIDVINKEVYLFGNAMIKYKKTTIEASYIKINWKKNTIYATSTLDSLGNDIGYPIFSENNDTFKASEIKYNFQTKKCYVKNISTTEGEGYILGKTVKKTAEEIFYLKNVDYTTCDHENPHYSIRANKIKIIPGKKIVTGPAYLTFFNIPTPILFPFGYFPNQDKKSSGILIPSYGESENLGFFLKNGGYYLTLSEKADIAIKSDIYTKGSWALRSNLRYKQRYKYNGNLNLSYGNMINSIKGFPDYRTKKDFFIRWNHQQDPKANPSLQFSANINAGSSTFHKNNSFNTNEHLTNTFQSSINITKRWMNSPFNLSTNITHSQNTQNKIINLTLPDITFNMNRLFPFKKIGKAGKSNWYHKIGVSYNMNTKNMISEYDSLLFTSNSFKNLRNGIKHSIPISTSMKIFKHFTLTPKINITERWYLTQIEKRCDNNSNNITEHTINKFTRGNDYSLSTGINTKIYGILLFNKKKISAIRHVFTPNLSFNYNPDFSESKYGYYKSVQNNLEGELEEYSIMEGGIFGSPSNQKRGNITLNLGNILEMKMKNNKNDTTNNIKKIKILESLNINTSYNIFKESFNLSSINLNARTRLLNIIDITFNSIYDPYIVNDDLTGNIEEFEINNNRIARLVSFNSSIGLNINQKTFLNSEKEEEEEEEEEHQNTKQEIPWELRMNYTVKYNKGYKSSIFSDTVQSLNFSGNIKITPKWKIGIQSGYDFDTKELTYTSVNIYRDLHCWEMLFNWIPIGFHKSYTITIRVKADVLKDLKYEKTKNWFTPEY